MNKAFTSRQDRVESIKQVQSIITKLENEVIDHLVLDSYVACRSSVQHLLQAVAHISDDQGREFITRHHDTRTIVGIRTRQLDRHNAFPSRSSSWSWCGRRSRRRGCQTAHALQVASPVLASFRTNSILWLSKCGSRKCEEGKNLHLIFFFCFDGF